VEALRHYLSLHRDNFVGAVIRLKRQPFASGLTILVIAIALAFPAALRVAINNANAVSESWQGAADLTVYLKMDVAEKTARDTAEAIEARADVAAVTLIDREAALEEFRSKSGFGEALDALDTNPLPHTLVVRPASGLASDIDTLSAAMRALPEADAVQIDTAWVARLRAMLALVGRFVDLATVLLGLAVAIVVGNTIRLEINNRSVEIEVTKLVGGTDAFIRRPFLYLGLSYGLAGALVAELVIALGLLLLGPPVRSLAALYGSGFELRGLSVAESALLLVGGALLGWAGAGLAAARHLRAIEPR
jgi:cell division transport system permease protein